MIIDIYSRTFSAILLHLKECDLLFALLSTTTHNNIKFDNNNTLFVFDQWERELEIYI